MATPSAPTVTTIEQLSINNPSYVSDPSDPTDDIPDDDILPPMPFDRQARPQSSRTTRSTTSRSSVNNLDGRVSCHDYQASKYFSYRVSFNKFNDFTYPISLLEPRIRKSTIQYSKRIFSISRIY